MNFILKPSFEHYALFKVANLLWSQIDIKAFVTEFSKSPSTNGSQVDVNIFRRFNIHNKKRERWQKFEDQVMEKMSLLT